MTWEGKRFPHQRRLKEKDLDRAEQKLVSRITDIEKASSFAALFDLIERAVGSLGGLGELYVYDTALRIGAQKRTLPQRAYLHAGARQGAKALGLEVAGVVGFFKSELPEALRELEAHEIEDVLCIYKLYFTGEQRDLDDEATCWVDEEIEDEMSPRTIKRNC